MTLFQSFFIAVLQGATELFPVSSLGHAVIVPRLLDWGIDEKAPEFLPFLVVLHLGTAAALLLYFWRDWLGFARAVIGGGRSKTAQGERGVFVLVCVATVPAVVFGYGLEHILRGFFASPALAAVFLVVNGFILFAGERLRKRAGRAPGKTPLGKLGWKAALVIGSCQALALIPGISRSGATMVGGLLAGLTHRDSARFSFLMATPVIAGAGVLEIPKLLKLHDVIAGEGGLIALAGLVAGVTAYATTWALMRYFRKNEIEALDPFAWYCWAAGVGALLLIGF
jgi:undecaprenyl-diphosphatase